MSTETQSTETIHPVQAELSKVLGYKKKDMQPFTKSSQLFKLATDIDELCEKDDDVWDTLSEAAQMWVNKALRALASKKSAPPFAEPSAAERNKIPPAAKKKETKPLASKKVAEDKTETTSAPSGKGYKGHKLGSQAEMMRKLYDEFGREVALAKAVEAGIKKTSAQVWIWEFKNKDAETE